MDFFSYLCIVVNGESKTKKVKKNLVDSDFLLTFAVANKKGDRTMKKMDAIKVKAIKQKISEVVANVSATNINKAYDKAYDVLEEIDEEYPNLKEYEEDENERWFDTFVGYTAQLIYSHGQLKTW